MTATPEKSARILVVDDEPGMLRAIERILGRRYEVTCVESAKAALEALPEVRPDLAIVDVRMPETNGFELTRALHERDAGVDVILMTGDTEQAEDTLIRSIDEGAFYFVEKPFGRRVLQTLVDRCLELRRLRASERKYLDHLEDELQEARAFQRGLLPPARHEAGGVSISAQLETCNHLAGDLYDYAVAEDGSVGLLVADVVGHGAAAAMLTSVVKSAFRAAATDAFRPPAVIERLFDGMQPFEPNRFVTLWCGRLVPGSGELTFVNAGHPAALLRRRDGGTEWLETTGPLVSSAFQGFPYDEGARTLAAGDRLLLYTDGVTETYDGEAMFGPERLEAAVTGAGAEAEIPQAVLEALQDFNGGQPFRDDVTLLGVRCGS